MYAELVRDAWQAPPATGRRRIADLILTNNAVAGLESETAPAGESEKQRYSERPSWFCSVSLADPYTLTLS
jgi:hypothetical protein